MSFANFSARGQKEEGNKLEKVFSSRILSEFPEISQLKDYETLNFEGNPIRSFQTLPKLQNLKRLIVNQTKISNFYRCLPQPKLVSFSCQLTPLSQYEFLNQMSAIVFGERLKRVNGVNLSDDEIKFGNEQRQKILPFLQNGYILTAIDPITVTNPKTNETRVLTNNFQISHVDSISTNLVFRDLTEEDKRAKKGTQAQEKSNDIKKNTIKENFDNSSKEKESEKSEKHERRRKPPPPIFTSCFDEEESKNDMKISPKNKQKQDIQNIIKKNPKTKISKNESPSSPKYNKSPCRSDNVASDSKRTNERSHNDDIPKPFQDDSPSKKLSKDNRRIFISSSSPKLQIRSSIKLEKSKEQQSKRNYKQSPEKRQRFGLLDFGTIKITPVKDSTKHKKKKRIYYENSGEDEEIIKQNKSLSPKLTKAQSTPSLFHLQNIHNGLVTLSIDENTIQPLQENDDSPLVELNGRNHNKEIADDNQSLNLTLTLDMDKQLPQHKQHKKAPKLSFDPPPLTNDDDITIPDEFSREDIKTAFFNMHKNEITTPEEFDAFIQKINKEKLYQKRQRE